MSLLPQILVNGILAGAVYGLIALGLSLIYGVMKFMNFAHGEMAMLGAFLYYYFFIALGWPILPSLLATLALCGLAGFLFDKLVFERLRQESQWTLLVTSIGVAFVIKALVLLVAGGASRNYIKPGHETTIYSWWDDRILITDYQIVILFSTALIVIGLALFLRYSTVGKTIRAVSDNMQAAAILGINVKKTIVTIFVLSTMLAGLAGVLIGYEQNLSPTMGLVISIMAFASVIVGGLGNVWGAVLGGFLMGLIQNLAVGVDWFGISISTSYKSAIAFIVLIIMLLVRPRGLFGISLEEEANRK